MQTAMKLLAAWGWSFNKAEVKDLIQEYIYIFIIVKRPFKDNHPGRNWLLDGLLWHPFLAPCKTEQLSSARARAQDPEVVRAWFNLLDEELTKAGMKGLPEQIFNVDESSFVTDPKSCRCGGQERSNARQPGYWRIWPRANNGELWRICSRCGATSIYHICSL